MVARITYSKRHSNFFSKVVDVDGEEQGCEKSTSGDSELYDLSLPLEGDCKLELLDFSSEEGKETFWHSSSHILGRTLEHLKGGFLTHGPPLNQGFFYDSFMGDRTVSPEDFKVI